ncbi:hypothetical protein GBAR_LOCUS11748 [Geodia barretti]|uniref:Uncharacterized protein n=1 Tax=Geodia barretti TaxID=519541 RepID=A0AA35RYH3_GEOBA|nr:hypothetical protein GBAR_LOCUS11748 [Geodia barretti]
MDENHLSEIVPGFPHSVLHTPSSCSSLRVRSLHPSPKADCKGWTSHPGLQK